MNKAGGWFKKRLKEKDAARFPDEAEFRERISLLRESRRDKAAIINRFPAVFGKIAGPVIAAASILMFYALFKISEIAPMGASESVFSPELMIFLLIGFLGGDAVFFASFFGKMIIRGTVYLVLSLIYILSLTLGMVAGLWNIPGIDPSVAAEGFLLIIASFITLVLTPILYAGIRSRSFFAIDGFSKGIVTILTVPCLAGMGYFFIYILAPLFKMRFDMSILVAVFFIGIIFVGLMLMAVMAGISLFMDGTNAMKRQLNLARKSGQVAVAALLGLIAYFIYESLSQDAGMQYFYGDSWKWLMLASVSSIIILTGFVLVTAVGFSDFLSQKAFGRWSKMINVEISRMEQEIIISGENKPPEPTESAPPEGDSQPIA